MRKCRTKTYVSYWISSFDGKGRIFIDVFPQQKWEYQSVFDNLRVKLTRNNITLEIPKEDFDRNWIIVENGVADSE